MNILDYVEEHASLKAKRLILRVDPTSQKIKFIYPKSSHRKNRDAFLNKNTGWIISRIEKFPEKKSFQHGVKIPIWGEEVTLKYVEQPRQATQIIRKDNEIALLVGGHIDMFEKRVVRYLKQTAKQTMVELSLSYAEKLNQKFKEVKIRDQSSRWGSCSANGTLSYSWRVIFAPLFVADYLAAHEVAHLQEMNHSKAFWNIVHGLTPNHSKATKWLKANTAYLHSFPN